VSQVACGGAVALTRWAAIPLVRHRLASFTRAWLGPHHLDEASPLPGATPERLARDEAELVVSIVGIDSAIGQTVHALARYEARDVVFGHPPADPLREQANGRLLLDLSRFDDVVPWERAASAPVAGDLQR
jgi:inward rectifier potassium channel